MFDCIFFILAGNKDMHNSLDGIEFQPNQTTDWGVTYPCAFDWILFILTGNEDNHKVSHEFEFRPDPTMDCGVSCP